MNAAVQVCRQSGNYPQRISVKTEAAPRFGVPSFSRRMSSIVGKVKLLSPNHRFVIALCSPAGVSETGPPVCPPEKKAGKLVREIQRDIFSGPVCARKFAELRRFPNVLGGKQPGFSAPQTEWRRERDSNPRYPLRYSGFQDRLIKPLSHPSAGNAS
jgi:hypothetical protein